MPVAQIEWSPATRIIPSRFPSIYLFDRVADAADFEALYALEAMTNDRLRDEIGQIELVPEAERLYGPGTGVIMAAFTHLNPLGSRFSNGTYGVFYAGREKATAIAECSYYIGRFMRATSEPPMQHQMKAYHVEVSGEFEDMRALPENDPIYATDSYSVSQQRGLTLRQTGSAGICYRSVRTPGGECIAAFRTAVLNNCRYASQMLFQWDGRYISSVFEKIIF